MVISLVPDLDAPEAARAAVREHFADELSDESEYTLLLVASELTTVAILRGALSLDERLLLRIERGDGCARIELSMAARRVDLSAVAAIAEDGGRLRLVAALSSRWGVSVERDVSFWAEVATAPAPAARAGGS